MCQGQSPVFNVKCQNSPVSSVTMLVLFCSWDYFPHDQARSKAYRWGEDGLLGICDRQCRLCLALALWNEKDPILKERLFGVTGPEVCKSILISSQ